MAERCLKLEALVRQSPDDKVELLAKGVVDPLLLVARVDLLGRLAQGKSAALGMTRIRCHFGILDELTKLFLSSNEVGFIVTYGRRNQDVKLGK